MAYTQQKVEGVHSVYTVVSGGVAVAVAVAAADEVVVGDAVGADVGLGTDDAEGVEVTHKDEAQVG